MAYLKKDQIRQIIQNAPQGTSPAGIISTLRSQGHQLEGYDVAGQSIAQQGVSELGLPGATAVPVDVAVGAAKGAVSTVRGAGSLGERMLTGGLRAALPRALEPSFGVDQPLERTSAEELIPESMVTPTNTAQNVGFIAEQIAEFLIPAGLVGKAGKATQIGVAAKTATAAKSLKLGKKGAALLRLAGGLGGLTARAGIEGVSTGFQRAIQTGEVGRDAQVVATVAAIIPFAGAVFKGVGHVFKKGGEKQLTRIIKPLKQDLQDGFRVENVTKHGIGGKARDLPEMLVDTEEKLNAASKRLEAAAKGSERGINLNTAFVRTKAKVLGDPKQFGDLQSAKRAFDHLAGEIDEAMKRGMISPNGTADVYNATLIKRGAGTKGAWMFGHADPDARATEAVYTRFYQTLRRMIEHVGKKEIRMANKEISELIPIQNALIRRIPVAQRLEQLSLTDSIYTFGAIFDPRSLLIMGANRLARNPRMANLLVTASKIMNKEIKSPLFSRLLGR